jgi:hypothetical protein
MCPEKVSAETIIHVIDPSNYSLSSGRGGGSDVVTMKKKKFKKLKPKSKEMVIGAPENVVHVAGVNFAEVRTQNVEEKITKFLNMAGLTDTILQVGYENPCDGINICFKSYDF